MSFRSTDNCADWFVTDGVEVALGIVTYWVVVGDMNPSNPSISSLLLGPLVLLFLETTLLLL